MLWREFMNVGKLCQPSVVTVRPFDDLTTAAQVMRDKHVGYLVVVEPALQEGTVKPVGVITDRDIVVAVVARDVNPQTLRVEEVMTREPVVASQSDTVQHAVQEMRRIGIRRIPVLGDRDELIGVLSLDDVIDTLAVQLGDVAGSIRSEQIVERVLRR
jgi:CBS domain-containing protein